MSGYAEQPHSSRPSHHSGRHGRYCTWLAAERSEDRDERRALYDVLQASWSDAVYFLERERLEACE